MMLNSLVLKLEQDKLNEIYNLVDCTINIANNEGFGLTTAESLMAGTPIIANVTGGLQDQMGFGLYMKMITFNWFITSKRKKEVKQSHGEWVVPVWPAAINLNGSVPTPYIFDDRVNDNEVADAIMKMYK